MFDTSGIGVFLGLDVSKGDHHAHGLTPAGKTVHDKRLPNSEPKLRALFDKLREKFGTVLVIANIGALPVAVARDAGCQVVYLAAAAAVVGHQVVLPPTAWTGVSEPMCRQRSLGGLSATCGPASAARDEAGGTGPQREIP